MRTRKVIIGGFVAAGTILTTVALSAAGMAGAIAAHLGPLVYMHT